MKAKGGDTRRGGWAACALAGAAGLLCAGAHGEDLYWKHAEGAHGWHEAANWGVGGTGGAARVPTAADKVYFMRSGAQTAYALELAADAEFLMFENATGVLDATFELNGHVLTGRAAGGCLVNLAATTAETEERTPRTAELTFRNGAVVCTNGSYGFLLGNHGGKNSGGLTFDNAAYLGNMHFDCNSRLVLTNGAVWHLKGGDPSSLDIPYYQGMLMWGGYVEITGAGSRFAGADGARVDGRVRSDRHVLYVENGGAAEFRNLFIGDDSRASTTSSVQVTDGTVDLSGDLHLGGASEDCAGNMLRLAGATPRVTVAAALKIYEQTGSVLRFDVSEAGYRAADGAAAAPLRAKAVQFVPRASGRSDRGAFAVRVRARAYFEAHPDSTVPLLRLDEPDKEALERLAAAAVFEDFIPAEYTAPAALAVNEEGTLLSLVAPAASEEATAPEFTVSAASAVDTTRTDFTLDVNTFGGRATALASVTCAFSVAGDWSDTVVSNWAGAVAGACPLTFAYAVDGLPEHREIPARITLVNDRGLSRTVELTFDSAGVSQTFVRRLAGVDDTWETLGNWYEKKDDRLVEALNELRAEDTLAWENRGNYVIRLARDHQIKNIAQANGWNTVDTSLYLFDLGGHVLELTQEGGQSIFPSGYCYDKADFAYQRSTVEFRNGTVNSPGAGFRLGNSGYPTGGGLVLSQGATLNAGITACVNGSRIIVKEGSVWNMTGKLTFQDSRGADAGSHGYGFLCVTGASSRVTCPDTISLGTDHTGVYALDGGEVRTYALTVAYVPVASNAFLDARNGAIKVDNVLQLGASGTAAYPHPEVRVSGETGFISAQLVYCYAGTGGRFVFTVPENGYRDEQGTVRAPMLFGELRMSARNEGYVDLGPTTLEIAARDWFRAHPKASIPLMRLNNVAGADALNALKAQVVWKDVHPGSFPAGFEPLSVSADGKTLVLTAPPVSGFTVLLR